MVGKDKCRSEELQSPKLRGSVDNFLENLSLVVDGIASILGKNCEVVLHDLRHPEQSIVAIANGHVTGRKIGSPLIAGPLDDKGLKMIIEQSNMRGVVSNYATYTRDGRRLKSTSITFRNAKGKPKIALCINLDLTEFSRVNELFSEICMTKEKSRQGKTGFEKHDMPGEDMDTIIKRIVEESISRIQKPIHSAEKIDKINVIKTMYERGLFLMKGGVDYAAAALGVSRFTIYNYLKELRYRE